MVENGRLRCAGGRAVVVAGDHVEELGEDGRAEVPRALLDEPEPQVHVSEEAPLVRRAKRGAAAELSHPADVVQERGREQEVPAETRMELGRLAAERCHADRVLEEAAGIAVVTVGTGRRQRPERRSELGILDHGGDHRRELRVCDLRREELEEAVQLFGVPAQGRCERGGIHVLDRLHGSDLHLQLASEALDPPEDLHRVSFREASVEELDVAPDAGVDPAARVGELEREVGGPCPCAPPLLLRDREDPLDGPILRELADGRHGASLGREGIGTLARMADVQPFRAVRYAGAAGPLADLVAPPYDAVDEEERAHLYTRSPYNVVHVTLPESVEEAGRLYRAWLSGGILEQEPEPASWLVVESFVGPDGIARQRHGVAVSVAAEPYETGHVLPHERTHPAIREERLRLLRATHVQPEPIFLLADVSLRLTAPEATPDLEVDGTRLWRLPGPGTDVFGDTQLLIADGHHRYEAAVAYGGELGSPARIMALVVPAHDPGLHVFPTHRVFTGRPDLADLGEGEPCGSLDEALARLAREPFAHAAAVTYRRDGVEIVRGRADELDVHLVDRHGLAGIGYTARASDAVAAVEGGEADVAFLLREPRVDDVFAVARSGERMPPKSTYFFPKPLSGLLFHPVGA